MHLSACLCSENVLNKFLTKKKQWARLVKAWSVRDKDHLCNKALVRSFALMISKSLMVEGGEKQSHWITVAFWRDCRRSCSTTSDILPSYLLGFVSRDLKSTLP